MSLLLVIYIFGWLAALGGNAEGWGIVIIGTIILVYILSVENKVDNYDISKVDDVKMWKDKTENNLSAFQVKENMINGKYDKK